MLMETISEKTGNLEQENKKLLTELEAAYVNMEMILEQSNKEKEITYNELKNRYDALEI